MENNLRFVKNKELEILFGVIPRTISKWMNEWVKKGILVPDSGTTRITSYTLSPNYYNLKISDLVFTE